MLKKELKIYQNQHAWQVFYSAIPYFCTLSGLGQQDNPIWSIYFESPPLKNDIHDNGKSILKAVPCYSFRHLLTILNEDTNTSQRYTFKIDKMGKNEDFFIDNQFLPRKLT